MRFSTPIDKSINIKPWCVKIETALIKYPELREYLDESNKLDFGNPGALSEYNKAIAFCIADLKIKVPDGNLIPAVSLRYAYIKIIAEEFLNKKSEIIEIGTGASAIISLLAAKLYNLKVTATEINESSLKAANNNIQINKMDDKITLVKSNGGILFDVIPTNSRFDALLTYPPTYTKDDLGKLNKIRGFKGVYSEIIGGGEDGFYFTEKLLNEALSNSFDINYISILVLFTSHINPIINILKSYNRKIQLIELIAGTRKRYIIIGIKKRAPCEI